MPPRLGGPRLCSAPMSSISDPALRAVFQPVADEPVRALLVAGACGNVGLGKLGQLARLVQPHGIPVIALDLSPALAEVPDRLRAGFGKRFAPAKVDEIIAGITFVQGGIADLPAGLKVGFVFEAIPERLDIKHAFYRSLRDRDPDALAFSATSGITTKKLFGDLPGADKSGVLHPFFPHLTNKLWELPSRGATTSAETLKTVRRMFGSFGMNLIEVGDVPAFAADRIFCGMMLEAVRIAQDMDLSPAQVDDACKTVLGTSPFFVHNLIPGANYLSAHCMELMAEEVPSTLVEIPESWRAYIADPKKTWPYEKGARCPADAFPTVRARMLGMLYALSARLLHEKVCGADQLNFLCENALAFRTGVPALMQEDLEAARAILSAFVETRAITHAEKVAPLAALDPDAGHFGELYVGRSVHDRVGLLSLKRRTINHAFMEELRAGLDAFQADPDVDAIVIAPDGSLSREFGHGADPSCFIPVLGKEADALEMVWAWKRIAMSMRSGKPTVAAIVGRCLGGSLELASHCHARIAGHGAVVAQPEPTVGVLPALGGCTMLHRWSRPEHADAISERLLTGHDISAEEALAWGILSAIVPIRDLPTASMALARDLASGKTPLPSFRDGPAQPPLVVRRDVDPRNAAGVVLDSELRELIASTIEAANNTGFDEGAKIEAEGGAKSLTLSSSKVGVQALLRGKPPVFEHPIVPAG